MHGGYAALRQMTLITCFHSVYTTGPPEDHRRPQSIAEGTTGEHKRPYQSAPSLSSFRRQLKTFLFHQSFPDIIL